MVWPHLTARPGWCGWPSRDRLSAAGDWAGAADAGNLLATAHGTGVAARHARGWTKDRWRRAGRTSTIPPLPCCYGVECDARRPTDHPTVASYRDASFCQYLYVRYCIC